MSLQKFMTTVLLLVWVCLCMPSVADAFQAVTPPPKKKRSASMVLRDLLASRIGTAESEAEKLRKGIAQRQEVLDSLNISQSAFDEVVKSLQTKRINLMIELAGLEVRQEEAKKLAAASAPIGGEEKELIGLLKKVAAEAKQNTQRVERLFNQSSAGASELAQARQFQAQAELKLAEVRSDMAGSPDQPQFVNQMLVETSLAKAERLAQLEMVNDLLKKYIGKARSVISDIERKNEQLDSLTQMLRQDHKNFMKIDDELRMNKELRKQDQSRDDH